MRLLYMKPKLKDLSQGSRISFIRQYRKMSQNEVSDRLGISGECKRRTMTRYERGNRSPSYKRLKEIADILNVNIELLKDYKFNCLNDYVYYFLWIEELFPNINIDFNNVAKLNDYDTEMIRRFINEWNKMRLKKYNRDITYYEYLDWKLNYEVNYEQ